MFTIAIIHYAMPFRCMQYDTMEYGKQLDELRRENEVKGNLTTNQEKLCGIRKQDRLAPVYTLCLYHGEEKWDGPRTLADMMGFAEGEDCFQHEIPVLLVQAVDRRSALMAKVQ